MWHPATLPLLLLLARLGGAVRDEGKVAVRDEGDVAVRDEVNVTATKGSCPDWCLQCCEATLLEAGFKYASHFKCVLKDGDTARPELTSMGCASPRPRNLWKGQYKSICPLEGSPGEGIDKTCEPVVLEVPAEAAAAGSALVSEGVGAAGPLVLELEKNSWLSPAGSGEYAQISGGFSGEVSVPFRDSTKPLKLRVGKELAAVVRFEDGRQRFIDAASIIYGTRPPFKSSEAEPSSTGDFGRPVYKWARVAPESATGLLNLFPHVGIYMVKEDGKFEKEPAFEFRQDHLSHQPTLALQVDGEGKRHPVARFGFEGWAFGHRWTTVAQGVDAALVLLGELALLRSRVLSDG